MALGRAAVGRVVMHLWCLVSLSFAAALSPPSRWGAQCRRLPALEAWLKPLRGGAAGAISSEKRTEGVRCRLKKGGVIFEVLCHTAKVELFREGAAAQADVLIAPDLFKDIKTGDRPSVEEVEHAFGHADMDKAVEEVLLKGDFQLSTAERRQKTDEKLQAIIQFIASNYMEPRTNLPIPRTRIENGIETLKGLKVEPFRSTGSQAEEIVKKLKELFPLVKNEVSGKVTVALALGGTTSGALHSCGVCKVRKDDYTDESYIAEIIWMANDYNRLIAELHKATAGQYELVQETGAGAVEDEVPKEQKGTAGELKASHHNGHNAAAKRKADQARGRERDRKRSESAGLEA